MPEVSDLDVSLGERAGVGVHVFHDDPGELLNGLALRAVVFVVLRAEPLRRCTRLGWPSMTSVV